MVTRTPPMAGATRLASLATLLWLLLAVAGSTGLQAQEPASYEAVIRDALEEFGRQHHLEAYALFSQAHQLQPNARTLRGMAACSFELRKYARALTEIRAALEEQHKPLDPTQRKEALELIRRAEQFVGRVQLELEPADAQASIDGIPVDAAQLQELDAGTHALRVRRDQYETEDRRLEIVGGQAETLRITLYPFGTAAPAVAAAPAAGVPAAQPPEPPANEPRGRLWTWVALGATGAFGVTTLAFGLKANSAYDSVDEQCPALTCTAAETERAIDDSHVTTFQTLTNVSIGLTAAAAATTLVLLFAEKPSESPPALSVGPGGAQLHLTF
jgi:hypothetical protein